MITNHRKSSAANFLTLQKWKFQKKNTILMNNYFEKIRTASVHQRLIVEMGPDPTRAYFWPAVNKRPTGVLYDLTRSNFFWPEVKKLKNLTFLGVIFEIQTQPDPGQKFLTRTHHYSWSKDKTQLLFFRIYMFQSLFTESFTHFQISSRITNSGQIKS